MWPGGSELGKRKMHVIDIYNDVAGSVLSGGRKGDYKYKISRKINGKHVRWQHEGTVRNFPRAQKNAVHLLLRVLKDAYQ
jgi:hypothetical protein